MVKNKKWILKLVAAMLFSGSVSVASVAATEQGFSGDDNNKMSFSTNSMNFKDSEKNSDIKNEKLFDNIFVKRKGDVLRSLRAYMVKLCEPLLASDSDSFLMTYVDDSNLSEQEFRNFATKVDSIITLFKNFYSSRKVEPKQEFIHIYNCFKEECSRILKLDLCNVGFYLGVCGPDKRFKNNGYDLPYEKLKDYLEEMRRIFLRYSFGFLGMGNVNNIKDYVRSGNETLQKKNLMESKKTLFKNLYEKLATECKPFIKSSVGDDDIDDISILLSFDLDNLGYNYIDSKHSRYIDEIVLSLKELQKLVSAVDPKLKFREETEETEDLYFYRTRFISIYNDLKSKFKCIALDLCDELYLKVGMFGEKVKKDGCEVSYEGVKESLDKIMKIFEEHYYSKILKLISINSEEDENKLKSSKGFGKNKKKSKQQGSLFDENKKDKEIKNVSEKETNEKETNEKETKKMTNKKRKRDNESDVQNSN